MEKKNWYEDIFDDEFIKKSLKKDDDFKIIDLENYSSSPLLHFLVKNRKKLKIYFLIISISILLQIIYLISILP